MDRQQSNKDKESLSRLANAHEFGITDYRILRKLPLAMSAGVLGMMALPAQAASIFGLAGEYNIFLEGDLTSTNNGDSEGAAAVGGDAVVSNYGVGAVLASGANYDGSATLNHGLAVEGNVTATGGSIFSGSGTAGGTYTPGAPGYTFGPGNTNGPFTAGTPTGINFSAEFASLSALSTNLAGLTATSTATDNTFGTLTFNDSAATTEIFNVSAADFACDPGWCTANSFTFNTAPGDKIIINVAGANPEQMQQGTTLNNATEENIIWNFYEATAVSAMNSSLQGSLLAVNADISWENGHVDGNTIGQSWSNVGNSEVHWKPTTFDGTEFVFEPEEPPAPVPLPASVWLFGATLAGLAGVARRKNQA